MGDGPDTNKKGDRNERQARRILNSKYRAERVPAIYGNNDPFRLADIMGLQEGLPFALIQVKTNRFTAKAKRYYRSWAGGKVDNEHTIFEVWVRYDRDGWESFWFDPSDNSFNQYWRNRTCAPENVRLDWRDSFLESLDSRI